MFVRTVQIKLLFVKFAYVKKGECTQEILNNFCQISLWNFIRPWPSYKKSIIMHNIIIYFSTIIYAKNLFEYI